MKICFEIPGNLNHGLWSPERGESRWAQNWANFLAREGHEIIISSDPGPAQWGDCPPIPNVTLIQHKDLNFDGDIYINPAWWLDRDIGKVKAKVYVHLTYGFEDSLKDPNHVKDNHVITYPYLQGEKNFIHDRNPFKEKTFALPTPLAETFGQSHFDKQDITYAAKDVFLQRHEQSENHWFRAGINVIKANIELANRYNLKVNFCMAQELSRSCPQGGMIIEKYGVERMLERARNKQLYSLMPLKQIMEVIDQSKIMTPVISPGGAMIEGVTRGVVPLTWKGSLFDDIAEEYDFLLLHNASYEQIESYLERLITDETFYNVMLKLYQKELEGHLYKNSREYFNAIINWGGL